MNTFGPFQDCVKTPASPIWGTDDTIELPWLGGDYVLDRIGAGTDDNVTGDLDVLVDVEIVGVAGQANVRGAPGFGDRILHVLYTPPVPITVTLTSLSILDGDLNAASGDCGGGIFNDGSDATLQLMKTFVMNNTVSGGTKADGGGICNNQGNVHMTASAVNDNIARWGDDSRGGGIFSTVGWVTLVDSKVSGNWAENSDVNSMGGGIYGWGTRVDMVNTSVGYNVAGTSGVTSIGGGIYGNLFSPATPFQLTSWGSEILKNSAEWGGSTSRGGGMAIEDGGTVYMDRTTVRDNTALSATNAAVGGALYGNLSESYFRESAFHGNLAQGPGFAGGSAMYLAAPTVTGITHFVNVTFSQNAAISSAFVGRGGAFHIYGHVMIEFHFVTIAENFASQLGDGVFIISMQPIIVKATIFDNSLTDNCFVAGGIPPTSLGYNIENGSTCTFLVLPTDLSPVDPLLFPLGDYGGPTWTHKIDFMSPATDHVGLPACTDPLTMPPGGLLDIDQRLFPRPGSGVGECDSGAFEWQPWRRSRGEREVVLEYFDLEAPEHRSAARVVPAVGIAFARAHHGSCRRGRADGASDHGLW